MKKKYYISHNFKRSCVEIEPRKGPNLGKLTNEERWAIWDYYEQGSNLILPEDISFVIRKCKKEYDIIFQ